LSVQVFVSFKGCRAKIGPRSSGSLTGSRTAGVCARIPVNEALAWCHGLLLRDGFKLPSGRVLAAMTYIDNLYRCSHSPQLAIKLADGVASRLSSFWRLSIKADSRECLLARGNPAADEIPPALWSYKRSMNVLGRIVMCDGGWPEDFEVFSTRAWAVFFANAGCKKAEQLDINRRLSLLSRSICPLVRWSSPMWVASTSVKRHLDSMQSTMVSICCNVKRQPCEPDLTWWRRRGKAVANTCRKMGKWSALHACLVKDWYDHCIRHTNDKMWVGALLGWMNTKWLQDRRILSGSRLANYYY